MEVIRRLNAEQSGIHAGAGDGAGQCPLAEDRRYGESERLYSFLLPEGYRNLPEKEHSGYRQRDHHLSQRSEGRQVCHRSYRRQRCGHLV